ncbi:MAG: T9SS C-terminal target domain-containing protein [Winogradskyella sp.]|uniref:T9SS type A sorting domain-containing protein n=1 Tax=Winogradskyella sp. TaxID=1883156 RepID=UPI000F3CD3D7|nr:T9SS type A sorting domain-containing protein [Winogradskyella sp.]RNC84252.1 MAG: T9SS C-terminal target domain-containing protein [Winogradskyella sp.]
MKKITFLLILLVPLFGLSQVNLEDFEGAVSQSTANGLGGFDVVTNPNPSGINTSANVGRIISSSAGDPWQQANLIMQDNLMDLTSDLTVTVDVYSEGNTFNLLARVFDNLIDTAPDATAAATYTDTDPDSWVTLTFTFNEMLDGQATANGEYDQISFFPNWAGSGGNAPNPIWNNGTDFTLYIDNITAVAGQALPLETCNDGILNNGETEVDCGGPNCDACPVPPAAAAPDAPDRNAQDVVSIFSGEYTDVVFSGIQTFGGGALTNITIDEPDDTRRVTADGAGGGIGYEFFGVPGLDLTDYDRLAFDVYIEGSLEPGQFLKLLLINCPNSDCAGIPPIETLATVDAAVGDWLTLDLDISTFTNGTAARDEIRIVQIATAGGTSAFGPIYFDNFYFYSSSVVNATCADAIPLALDGTPVPFGNVGAGNSGISASCDSGTVNDVWYEVVADSNELFIESTAPQVSVFSDCSGTEIACNPGTSAITVMMGSTYYIRLNDDGTTRAPGTGFTVRASGSAFSTNDFNLDSFRVYPNPSNSTWTIEGANTNIDTIEVYDILGKRVQTLSPNSQEVTIDAAGLKTGIYLAKLYSGDAVRTLKLVKN